VYCLAIPFHLLSLEGIISVVDRHPHVLQMGRTVSDACNEAKNLLPYIEARPSQECRICADHFKNIKSILVTGRGGCETSRLPHFIESRLRDGGDVVSLTSRPHFSPPGRFLVLISA
jgi:hypothetical protein